MMTITYTEKTSIYINITNRCPCACTFCLRQNKDHVFASESLTPIILRELIEKIEVFPVEGKGKNRTQRVIVHYRFIGTLDVPGVVERPHYVLDSRQGVAIEYLPSAV